MVCNVDAELIAAAQTAGETARFKWSRDCCMAFFAPVGCSFPSDPGSGPRLDRLALSACHAPAGASCDDRFRAPGWSGLTIELATRQSLAVPGRSQLERRAGSVARRRDNVSASTPCRWPAWTRWSRPPPPAFADRIPARARRGLSVAQCRVMPDRRGNPTSPARAPAQG
jgi:hypothetical protein